MDTNFPYRKYNLTQGEVNQVIFHARNAGISLQESLEEIFPELAEETNQSEEEIAADYAQYAESVANTKSANTKNATNATNETNATSATTATFRTHAQAKKVYIKALEERDANLAEMQELEVEIQKLAKEAESQITAAIQAQEEAVEQYEEDTEKAVDAELQKYIEANKNGDGMSRDELKTNMANALGNIPNISDSIANIIDATASLDKMDSKLDELDVLINDTMSLNNEIENLSEIMGILANCDPIGFTMEDENGQQVQYDFIVDDGNFDSTSDFLGAEGQWSEMVALNTDGDNTVSADELAAGNIKAVKTNADGTQEIVDIKEEFGEDFSIDLSSYQQGGSHSAVSNGDHDNDGVADQTLLGTFNVNVNGQSISGYNTLDDIDYLSETFGVSAGEQVEAATAGSAGVTSGYKAMASASQDLSVHEEFWEAYNAEYERLSQKLDNAWSGLDVSKDTMENFRETSKTETMNEAEAEKEAIEAEQEQEAENVKQDGEFLARAAEANDVTEDELTEEQIDKYYEEEYAA